MKAQATAETDEGITEDVDSSLKGIAAGTAESSNCREGYCGKRFAEDMQSKRPEEGSQVSSWRVNKGIAAGTAGSSDCKVLRQGQQCVRTTAETDE